MSPPTQSDGPLRGLRIIDCSTILAGPITAAVLGDFGAEVIKIEHPDGDPLRKMGYAKAGVGLWWTHAVVLAIAAYLWMRHSPPRWALR